MDTPELLYVGVRGCVVAYDQSTGQQVWSTPLNGSLFVNLILEGEKLFAHTKGELFALDARTGRVLWRDGLKGFGYGLATLVSRSSPANNFAVLAEHAVEEEQRNSASSSSSATHTTG